MTSQQKYYHLLVYGCQMNEADSEVLAGMLHEAGYQYTAELEESDLILLITCAVRDKAEQKIYGKIGELARLKQSKPDMILGISGCMPQQEQIAEKLRQRFPVLDIIFGTHNLHKFPQLLAEAQHSTKTVYDIWNEESSIVEGMPKHRTSSFRAYINITFGCNNFCTYCIVPFVRGRERSRKPQDIVTEVENLLANGYKEIMLLGQNVNSYGKDFQVDYDFADLLSELDTIVGLKRLRFMTSHPRDITDKLISVIADSQSVCEHIHLPLQAGSNKVLQRMNRGYTREHYFTLVDKIRDRIPNCSITTDLIVGFPSETEADFKQTLDAVEKVKYDAAFTFAYSPRQGTPAATMKAQISEEEKKDRLHRLIDAVNEVALRANELLVGTVQKVMIEGPSKRDSEVLSGRTRSNKLVHLTGQYGAGEVVDVRIDKAQTFLLWGTAVKE